MTTDRTSDTELFGHPRGMMVLATTEMWERFSFYGMQALLLLYMTKYLLLPEHARDVFGLAAFRAGLSSVLGPMTDLAFAAQTYGIYSGLIYGTPLIGAWLGDRVLGKTRTVTLGCLLMSVGHLAMASERLFIVALLLIIVGAGGVIGNMAAQVGKLYAPDDHRRTRAFGMLIGLATYLMGRRHLPPDVIRKRGDTPKLTRTQWRQVGAIFALLVPYTLYSVAAQQAYAIMYVWGDTAVDRTVLGWEVPVTWIGIIDGLFTILAVVIANRTWFELGKRGKEPDEMAKMTIGYTFVGAAYLFAAGIATMTVVPVILWMAFYLIMDQGFGWAEAPIQSLISRDAPPTVNATMMAVWKASTMIAFFLVGWTGRFYEPLGAPWFWVLTGSLSFVAVAMNVVGKRWMYRMLEADEVEVEAAVPA